MRRGQGGCRVSLRLMNKQLALHAMQGPPWAARRQDRDKQGAWHLCTNGSRTLPAAIPRPNYPSAATPHLTHLGHGAEAEDGPVPQALHVIQGGIHMAEGIRDLRRW